MVSSASEGAITNISKLRGGYLTFRAGPTLFVPITEKFSGHFSIGVAVAYAGSTYEVSQTFRPDTGTEVSEIVRDGASTFLPGFYVDADLQYALNESSGFYLGAVYQSTGSYTQNITDLQNTSEYTTKVDLSSLQGIRAGMSFKF